MKKHFSLLMLAAFFLFGCNSIHNPNNNHAEKITQIKAVLAEAKKEYGLSAILFNLQEGEHIIMTETLGISAQNIPAQKEMNYRAGGVTETMLVTILMKLIDEGKYNLTLDDSLDKWFPEFPYAKQVTLRMLGNSTSGYYDYLNSDQILNANDLYTKTWDPLELVKIGVTQQILFEPGTQFNYSHTNFCILGLVLEKITHQNLVFLIDNYISKPLNLHSTRYAAVNAMPSPALHSYVTLQGVFNDATNWTPSWAGPSGMVTSNLVDLGKWMAVFGSGKLLSAKSHQQLIQAVPTGQPGTGFALGFGILNSWYLQNPNINGYKTIAAYLPSKKLSLIITTTDGITSNPDTHYAQLIFPKIAAIVAPDAHE